jgi:uncharacterized protein (DUF1697 family)
VQWIAFFRGINVGGKHVVRMADLKRLFEDCGFRRVRTYIQSGNVVFEADADEETLRGTVADTFARQFGFPSDVVLRTAQELAAIVAALPFSVDEIARAEAADPDVAHVYAYLSSARIDPEALRALQSATDGPDRLAAGPREIYLLCYPSVRDSKLAASLSKLDVPLTARNLNTLNKLLSLARESGTVQSR